MKYLKITSLRAGEYIDRDEILLHAAFQVFKDFVEKEKGIAKCYDKEATKKMWKLYQWWVRDRSRNLNTQSYYELADPSTGMMKYEVDDQQMLTELINMRLTLWT